MRTEDPKIQDPRPRTRTLGPGTWDPGPETRDPVNLK